jgi:hypothetical protein
MKSKKHDRIGKLSIDDQIAQTRYAGSLVTVLDEVFKKFEEDEWPYVDFTRWFKDKRFRLKIMEYDQIREAYHAGFVSHPTVDKSHGTISLSDKYYKEKYGESPFIEYADNWVKNKHKK